VTKQSRHATKPGSAAALHQVSQQTFEMGHERPNCDVRAMSACPVRRVKAALFQWVQVPPGNRSNRKQPEQSWR